LEHGASRTNAARSRIVHSLADVIRARIFAIACGYEDGNDLDDLRNDPAFKLACGRLPDTDRDVPSRPYLAWRMHRVCATRSD
jgi:erythromycin esterase-like protein